MACHRASSSDSGEAGDSHIPHISSSPGGREAGKPWLEPSALRTPRLADSWPGLGSGSGCASAPLKLLEVLEPPAQKQSPRQADWHPRRCLLSHCCWHAWPLFLRSCLKPLVAVDPAGRKLEESALEDRSPQLLTLVDLLAEPEFHSGSDEQVGMQQKHHCDLARESV